MAVAGITEKLDEIEDEELVEMYRDGDAFALEILSRRFLSQVYNKVCYLVPEQDAEDVTQNIFLSLTGHLHQFQNKCPFKVWFWKIIASNVGDYYRKAYREKMHMFAHWQRSEDSEAKERKGVNNEEEMLLSKLIAEQLVSRLPKDYREIIQEFYLDGFSLSELCQEKGEAYEAVRSRERRAERYMADRIERD